MDLWLLKYAEAQDVTFIRPAPSNKNKWDNYINLLKIISIKKIDKNLIEIQINNKSDNSSPNLSDILTKDVTKWILKFEPINLRNEWFDSINFFISASKPNNKDGMQYIIKMISLHLKYNVL